MLPGNDARQQQAGDAVAPPKIVAFGRLGTVCRLGLATRGNTSLACDDVLDAIERGINYLNWCGHSDGLSRAIAEASARRRELIVATQLQARTADEARREIDAQCRTMGTDYIDVVTYYYVECEDQWQAIVGPGGAAEGVEAAVAEGTVRAIGLTSHQRPLAARWAESGRLDMLMLRYNAAHRGAEQEVFPLTRRLAMPVVTYTGLRWGALMRSTPDDPTHFHPPTAPQWYRFALCQEAITTVLMAPNGRRELEENLTLLEPWQGIDPTQLAAMRDHGDRVRRHAGHFP